MKDSSESEVRREREILDWGGAYVKPYQVSLQEEANLYTGTQRQTGECHVTMEALIGVTAPRQGTPRIGKHWKLGERRGMILLGASRRN